MDENWGLIWHKKVMWLSNFFLNLEENTFYILPDRKDEKNYFLYPPILNNVFSLITATLVKPVSLSEVGYAFIYRVDRKPSFVPSKYGEK